MSALDNVVSVLETVQEKALFVQKEMDWTAFFDTVKYVHPHTHTPLWAVSCRNQKFLHIVI